MERIEITVELPADEVCYLHQLAETRHCTVADLIELAVESFVERKRASTERSIKKLCETVDSRTEHGAVRPPTAE